jgi:hypothetical protein
MVELYCNTGDACCPAACRVTAVRPFAEAVKYTVELYCDTAHTPWCLPAAITQRPAVKREQHVHAVASGITRR